MKKVFSIEKYRESMTFYYTQEELDIICNDPKWWVKKCEGLTEEEMNENCYVTEAVWMVEVEENDNSKSKTC